MPSTLSLLPFPVLGDAGWWGQRPLVALACSRRFPAGAVLPTYEWAIAQREAGAVVASGFESRLEQDALHYLLAPVLGNGAAAAPVVVWVCKGALPGALAPAHQAAVAAGRLVLVAPLTGRKLRGAAAARALNEWLFAQCATVFVPYARPGGALAHVLAGRATTA